ncbi:MAG TPA: energy-coupling factor ABC transporter substrate-binding protein [Fusibacter sp.]|nr:energy-coupling factor ABC transporter substrate-binding protein [Fusibacter sp.]
MKKQNLILMFIFALLVIIPLIANPDAEYGGSDGNAKAMVTEIQPTYEPWFEPLWEPPSGEVESLMFTLLAVTGASTIGYYLGSKRGKKS